MMSRSIAFGAFLGLLTSAPAWGKILPDNNLYLEDQLDRSGNITESEFYAIIAKARSIYVSPVKNNGGRLDIVGHWDDSTVNASATQYLGAWTVNMYGGLARRPEVTPDGFTLVLCHELGHHMAGFPFASNWAANEGQADYFASNHCASVFWAEEEKKNAAAAKLVHPVAKTKCDQAWHTESAQNLCYRTMNAGQSLANLLAALKRDKVSFTNADQSQVKKTEDGHPEAQCRLDTYIAGAVCTSEYDVAVIPGKENGRGWNHRVAEEASAAYSCTARDHYQAGLRPRCWFKPNL